MSNERISAPDNSVPSLELLKGAAYVGTLHDLFQHDTLLCLRACKEQNEGALKGRLIFEMDEGAFDEFQFWYRSLVRAFSAQVEGVGYQMRRVVVEAADRGEAEVSKRKRSQLLEDKRFNKFERNVELAFEFFPLPFGQSYILPQEDPRWADFLRFIEIRNCITHPKSQHDFIISAEDLPVFQRAMSWFAEAFVDLMKTCGTHVSPEAAERNRREREANLPAKTAALFSDLRDTRAHLKQAWKAPEGSEERERRKAEAIETLLQLGRRLGVRIDDE